MALEKFNLDGGVVVITGGAGLLGVRHADAIAEAGGVPVLLDIDAKKTAEAESALNEKYSCNAKSYVVDITDEKQVAGVFAKIVKEYGKAPYGLINNAAIDPKFDAGSNQTPKSRLEVFPLEQWKKELDVGLTGSFLCAKVFGTAMAEARKGVIVNIASDLGIVAPDQRIYREAGIPGNMQKVKPITYSVIKHGIIGMTKYLATYWAEQGVRCNALAPGGVFNTQPKEFVGRLTSHIPLGRMAGKDEYKSAIQFLISDASSYMTGATLVMDGGRTCW